MRPIPAFMAVLLLVAGAAAPTLSNGPEGGPLEPGPRVAFQGRVVHVELEGGFWGILSKDGQRFDPIALPPRFQRDGLEVEVTAIVLRDTVSIRMWGQLIRILNIREAGTGNH